MAPLATNVDMWNRLLVCPIVYFRWPESSDGKNRSIFGKLQSRCLLQTYIWSNNVYNHKVRHVVGSILIIKYRSWCTLTFQKCVKKGKLCQNGTLSEIGILRHTNKSQCVCASLLKFRSDSSTKVRMDHVYYDVIICESPSDAKHCAFCTRKCFCAANSTC